MTKILIPCGALLILLAGQAAAQAPVGKIASVKGEAFIAHPLKAKEAVKVGGDVLAQDKISTGADGEVVVDMNGEAQITIGPGSYFKIQDKTAKNTSLEMFSGKVQCKVDKLGQDSSFTVKTPSAVAGVRGTQFETVMDNKMNTMVAVSEGKVWNADPQNVGQPIIVEAGKVCLMMATGQSVVGERDAKANLGQMIQMMKDSASQGMLQQVMAKQEGADDANRQQLLQVLEQRISVVEARIQTIQAEQAKRDLPAPPTTPNN